MEDVAITRIMPNSLEAEQSVVGSMIMDKQAIITAGEMLVADDFYHNQYGVMFQTMVDMNNEGRPVDIVTLQERLKEKNVSAEVYSLEFIRDLLAAVPTSANIHVDTEITVTRTNTAIIFKKLFFFIFTPYTKTMTKCNNNFIYYSILYFILCVN